MYFTSFWSSFRKISIFGHIWVILGLFVCHFRPKEVKNGGWNGLKWSQNGQKMDFVKNEPNWCKIRRYYQFLSWHIFFWVKSAVHEIGPPLNRTPLKYNERVRLFWPYFASRSSRKLVWSKTNILDKKKCNFHEINKTKIKTHCSDKFFSI